MNYQTNTSTWSKSYGEQGELLLKLDEHSASLAHSAETYLRSTQFYFIIFRLVGHKNTGLIQHDAVIMKWC